MGKYVVVDENDNIIAFKERNQLEKSDIYRVSSLWIINSKNQVLLGRRALSKSHDPNKWSPAVNGTVEEGETYLENVVKETEEELGLKNIKPRELIKKRRAGEYNYFVTRFSLIGDFEIEDLQPDPREISELKWFSLEDLRNEMESNPDTFVGDKRSWGDWIGELEKIIQ